MHTSTMNGDDVTLAGAESHLGELQPSHAAGTVTQDDNGEIHIFPRVFNKQMIPFRHCKEGAATEMPRNPVPFHCPRTKSRVFPLQASFLV
jgi:hypothetical protein